MSKLIEKAKGINFDDVDAAPAAPPVAPERPRTAIGAISASLALGREVEAENRALKSRLQAFEDATLVEWLDPRKVRPSRFANRHALSFAGAEFESLKSEIAAAGRNVQPIKVRRLAAPAEDGVEYEIAFGHRRHRACLDLGLPVAAVVQQLSDAELFAEMDRENRERANLSPWEQGVMYQRALEQGLFPSLRKLAAAVGAQVGNVSTAVQLASLPQAVVDAFGSPLVLQYRWAAPLGAALSAAPEAVLERARALAALSPRPPAKEVLARLLGQGAETERAAPVEFRAEGRRVGTLDRDAGGGLVLRVAPGALSAAQEKRLVDLVRKLLEG